ncbi:Lhr-like helicase [Paraburkholderia sp. CI2]|nr:Lhr-like helicase [Paraburkholderia sp. CI2]
MGPQPQPLSSELADATLTMLARAADGIYDEPELRAVRPLLELQRKWSALPEPGVLVVELLKSREGHHFFCYPFAGHIAHIGLGALLAGESRATSPARFRFRSTTTVSNCCARRLSIGPRK